MMDMAQEKSGIRVNTFCILSGPRMGSTWLCGLIDSHAQVVCHDELFHPMDIFYRDAEQTNRRRLLTGFALRRRDRDPRAFLKRLIAQDAKQNVEMAAWGFKLFPEHNEGLLREICESQNWTKIVLSRGSLLAQYSSLKIAQASGEWVDRNSGKKRESLRIRFAPDDFEEFRQKVVAREEIIYRNLKGKEYLHIEYEEIEGRFSEIVEYLKLPSQSNITQLSKTSRQNTADVLARFENIRELENYFEEHALDDRSLHGQT